MANKLISASDLITSIRDDPYIDGQAFARVKRYIEETAAVDAVEVVHGRWEGTAYNIWGEYEEQCSHCKRWSTAYGSDYCPNCGARMDGDGNV